jgi:hypothetical protein
MAHFAKLKSGNIVEQVITVKNEVITDNNNQEQEQLGVEFLRKLYNEPNAVWKQTSYNNNFRKNYAGKDFVYDEQRNAFIPPKPFNSWVLDEDTCRWKAPVEKPITYDNGTTDNEGNPVADLYVWNEQHYRWDKF